MNKKAQLQVLLTPPILFIIIGAILGYLVAGTINVDRNVGLIIGGLIGFFLSTRSGGRGRSPLRRRFS